MTDIQNHKLANLARQELKRREQRRQILFSDSEKALDLILDAPSPATLVQSFPDQDLYYLMHKIGVHDFAPVLAMANSGQWEYILDVEVWDDDRLDTDLMTQVFSLLFKADPQRLLRWTMKEKPDFFEFYLFKNIQVVVREHDEIPPEDFDDYITLDDKFYFRFPNKVPQNEDSEDNESAELLPGDLPLEGRETQDEAPELIEQMLKAVAQMDLTVFHGLLLETCGILTSETEEEQFRLKNLRLAEKGFEPTHQAIGIYQPTRLKDLRKRPKQPTTTEPFDPDAPLTPQFFTQFIQGENLFVTALAYLNQNSDDSQGAIDLSLALQSELAALINKVISADRIKIREKSTIEKTIQKATAYLSLGLEIILKGDIQVKAAAQVIQNHFLEDIFRTGSREGIQLKTRATTWYETSFIGTNHLPLSFLGESYLGVIGGLLIDRPMFFADYAEKELYREFKSLGDIQSTARILDEIIHLDQFLKSLTIDMTSFTQGVLTYKSMILTLWARNRMGLDTDNPSLAPMDAAQFSLFFTDLFIGETPGKIDEIKARDLAIWAAEAAELSEEDLPIPLQAILYGLINELEEEYGDVTPETLDPRFMPLFLIETITES